MVGGEFVRVMGSPLSYANRIRDAVLTRPGARLVGVRTLEDQLTLATASRTVNTRLFVAFAGLAMLLAVVGVAGVLRYAVAQRTAEIGLRLALGAERGDILRMILSYATSLVIAGIVIGLAGAVALLKYVAGLLYGIPASDPWTYLVVCLSLSAAALGAAYVPARKAMALEPITLLRTH